MIAFLGDVLTGASLAGFLVVAVMFLVRVVAHIRGNRRLHRRRANRWFIAGYRVGHRHASQGRVERRRRSG